MYWDIENINQTGTFCWMWYSSELLCIVNFYSELQNLHVNCLSLHHHNIHIHDYFLYYSIIFPYIFWGPSWPWSYGSWIYKYLCNQCLSPLMLWVRILIRARWTTLCDKFCQWLATGQWFSPGYPVSSTNKTDRHDITEILLKVVLNTIKQTNIYSVK
jgi:hypothetical protein